MEKPFLELFKNDDLECFIQNVEGRRLDMDKVTVSISGENEQFSTYSITNSSLTLLPYVARFNSSSIFGWLLDRMSSSSALNTFNEYLKEGIVEDHETQFKSSFPARESFFQVAARYNSVDVFNMAVNKFPGVELKKSQIDDDNHLTAMEIAVITGNIEMITALHVSGEKINYKSPVKHMDTYLHLAAEYDVDTSIKTILEISPDLIYETNSYGVYPIQKAISMDHSESVRLMLSYFDPDLVQYQSHINLFENAIEYSAIKSIRQLVDLGWTIGLDGISDGSHLIKAVKKGSAEMVEFLIDQHSNLEAVDENGMTALEIASKGNKERVISILEEAALNKMIASPRM